MTGLDFWGLLLISLIEIICSLFFAFYRMLFFAHKDDTRFGVSKLARSIIVGGMFMWVIPIVWIPVDILLSLHSDLSRKINFYVIMTM